MAKLRVEKLDPGWYECYQGTKVDPIATISMEEGGWYIHPYDRILDGLSFGPYSTLTRAKEVTQSIPSLSPQAKVIAAFLGDHAIDEKSAYISPSTIGRVAGGEGRHSSWASPKCKRMVEIGIMKRSDAGHYKLLATRKLKP